MEQDLDKMDHNENINEEQRKNEQYVENLIATLAASEWKDSSIIYLYAITMRLLSFLKINNCYKVVIKKSRYKNAGKAAEKRWNELNEKLENLMENEIKNLKKLLDKNNNIAKTINKKEHNNFESLKKEIKNICDALIEIYKDRTKN